MSVFSLLCAFASIVTGIVGFKLASENDSQHLYEYLLAMAISFPVLIFCGLIVNQGKSRYLMLCRNNINQINPSVRSIAAFQITLITALVFAAILYAIQGLSASLIILMLITAQAGQIMSHDQSTFLQLKNNHYFWKVQFVGSMAKALFLIASFKLFEPNFFLLAASTMLTTIVVISAYRINVTRFSKLLTMKIYLLRIVGSFSVVSAFRATRPQLLNLMFSSTAIGLANVATPSAGQAALVSTPYLNALYTAFTQIFNRYEVYLLRNASNSTRTYIIISSIMSTLGALSCYIFLSNKYTQSIVPVMAQDVNAHVKLILSVSAGLIPFTASFSMIDLLPSKHLIRMTWATAALWILISVAVLITTQYVEQVAWFAMCAPLIAMAATTFSWYAFKQSAKTIKD
jgi:hypothetical protein